MLAILKSYYSEHGILSTFFTCRHKLQCEGDCQDFTGPKSAFVSTGYELGELPRLLFMSLDSGSADKDGSNRTPEAVREQEEIGRDVLALPKHKHWYRTHELAWYIFRRFDPTIKLTEAKSFFAHANSAKCCMNKLQNKKANAVLFKNCKDYTSGELKILQPDILVTQGSEAKGAIVSLRPKTIHQFDKFASFIELEDKNMFWLHTYHPSNWGAFNRQRAFNKETKSAEGWERYCDQIYEFIGHV